jgi:hypothetical protein
VTIKIQQGAYKWLQIVYIPIYDKQNIQGGIKVTTPFIPSTWVILKEMACNQIKFKEISSKKPVT